MGKYCPYKDAETVYLDCRECDNRICEKDTFYCLIIGTRSVSSYEYFKTALDHLLANRPHTVIVSGGTKGAEPLSARYANEKGYEIIPFRAQGHTKNAALETYDKMHEYICRQAHRGVVVFWDGKSSESRHMIDSAQSRKTPMRIIHTAKGAVR